VFAAAVPGGLAAVFTLNALAHDVFLSFAKFSFAKFSFAQITCVGVPVSVHGIEFTVTA
jgi:hypothetical protein